MLKLKKNYTLEELKALSLKGEMISRNWLNDTSGTSSMGYMERRGIKINGTDYQVIYTSKGHATRITADIVEYNGRYLQKHDIYINQVNKHFSDYIYPLLNN